MNNDMHDERLSAAAAEATAARTLDEALSEVNRELSVRERCFPRWVSERKLDSVEAKDRIERLSSAAKYLEMLLDKLLSPCNALHGTAGTAPA